MYLEIFDISNIGIGTTVATAALTVQGRSILNGIVTTCNQDILVGSGSVYASNFYGIATQVSKSHIAGDYYREVLTMVQIQLYGR
jgi:hypothetical protein